jgi:hypothetical protein
MDTEAGQVLASKNKLKYMRKLFIPLLLAIMAFAPAGDKISDELAQTPDSTISANGKKGGIWLMYKNETNHPVSKAKAKYIEKVYYDDDFLVSRSNKKAPIITVFRAADSLSKAATGSPALLNGKYEGVDHLGDVVAEYTYKDGILKLLCVYGYPGGIQAITHKENFERTYKDEPFTGYVENISAVNSVGGYYHKVEKYHKWMVDYPFSYGDM